MARQEPQCTSARSGEDTSSADTLARIRATLLPLAPSERRVAEAVPG